MQGVARVESVWRTEGRDRDLQIFGESRIVFLGGLKQSPWVSNSHFLFCRLAGDKKELMSICYKGSQKRKMAERLSREIPLKDVDIMCSRHLGHWICGKVGEYGIWGAAANEKQADGGYTANGEDGGGRRKAAILKRRWGKCPEMKQ